MAKINNSCYKHNFKEIMSDYNSKEAEYEGIGV
jgi:hypothetical protein